MELKGSSSIWNGNEERKLGQKGERERRKKTGTKQKKKIQKGRLDGQTQRKHLRFPPLITSNLKW